MSLILLLVVVTVLAGGVLQAGRYGNSPYRSDWPQLAIITTAALLVAAHALSR